MWRTVLFLAVIAALAAGGWSLRADAQGTGVASAGDAREALARAREQGRTAAARAEKLEAEAASARDAAARTARESAALAARIQQSEARIAAAEARLALLGRERALLRGRLAERQQPVVRLTGALQQFARRPVAVSVLRPGSLKEAVYLRAMLASTIPEVSARTADLRAEIERGRALEREARQAAGVMRAGESELEERRQELAALETRQRLASRDKTGAAARESDRALALAEEARSLDALVGRLEDAGSLREELAALPGPRLRPRQPELAEASAPATASPSPESASVSVPGYQFPVSGPITTGFGAVRGGVRSDGLTFSARDRAQVVAPGPGRIAFAGPYRGYDRIVIIEHAGGFTSLVTGLLTLYVETGEEVVAGAPLGLAGTGAGNVTLELRKGGETVNPLSQIR